MSILGDRILAQRKISCVQLAKITAPDFDLAMTLGSGQVFHWEKLGDGFVGVIGDRPVYVEQRGDSLLVSDDCEDLVRGYFALDHPLAEICASFPDDSVMSAAKEFCRGLRIIRQPKWECLATFICSSMKQVAHIRQISRNLRERFGQPRNIGLPRSIKNADGGSGAPRAMLIESASPTFINIEQGTARSTNTRIVFTFPPADRIAQSSEKELRKCALGYRAKNLLATARLVSSGDCDLEKLAMRTDVDLRARLCELPGVGAKVANCVMLFAYERLRAFPIDVWIERVLRESYFPRARRLNAARLRAFTEGYFGDHGGYAQQYLFHHARMNKNRGSRTARRAVPAKMTKTRA
jgi:N-glycosylase/DNA lyase